MIVIIILLYWYRHHYCVNYVGHYIHIDCRPFLGPHICPGQECPTFYTRTSGSLLTGTPGSPWSGVTGIYHGILWIITGAHPRILCLYGPSPGHVYYNGSLWTVAHSTIIMVAYGPLPGHRPVQYKPYGSLLARHMQISTSLYQPPHHPISLYYKYQSNTHTSVQLCLSDQPDHIEKW